MPGIWDDVPPWEIKPRRLDVDERCPDCKSGPMFHPAHPWGPCIVTFPAASAVRAQRAAHRLALVSTR